MKITAQRYHDFSYGHRVCKHESKCAHLHGHNGRVHFVCQAENETSPLDTVGRVIDFSVIKSALCMWLEDNWDHKFLIWEHDPMSRYLLDIDPTVVLVPFNPTAENMAQFLVETIGPVMLAGTGVSLVSVTVEETAKCSATFNK